MNKYVQTLVKNVRKKLDEWLNKQDKIEHEDLYRFLHSIAGTALTIGFNQAGEIAKTLMEQLDKENNKQRSQEEVKEFLFPLITVFYQQEVNVDIEDQLEVGKKKFTKDNDLILLIDDDVSLLMFLKEELEKYGWIVIAVAEPKRAIQSYYDLNPQCVIIDINMKGTNGLDVLLQLKDRMKKQVTPTIMISMDGSKETRLKSYQFGADDFIQKPLEIDELTVRIARQLERKKVIEELIRIDELTRVYNANHLPHIYDQLVSNFNRDQERLSIAIIDLDHFRKINDAYGHVIGDKVLVTFAEHMKNKLRPNDTIIRYGGEEFIVLLPETNADEAKVVLERLLKKFADISFTDVEELEEFNCTFSAGIKEVEADELSLLTNIGMAEGALMEAKNSGRNQVIVVPHKHISRPQKVLHVGIVDDDPIIRTMLEELISKSKVTEGLTVDIQSFTNGMDFYESEWRTKTNERYLIVLDGMMPRMDGIEVLQKIRESDNQHNFTVIMLTSRKSDQDIALALTLGADDYLTKPFKLLELETRIGHLIKRMKS
ncbi:response regulator [Aquibacillus kalidii]|uniref:response regulator n=1 Tax=Aquibacillus kalidii TaxID=2762597 RepID=UPI001644F2DB|nr:response regulator [Aquibacillus kalidii]